MFRQLIKNITNINYICEMNTSFKNLGRFSRYISQVAYNFMIPKKMLVLDQAEPHMIEIKK